MIQKYITISLLIFSLFSCNLDINHDPSFPEDSTPDKLISSGITWTSASLGGDLQLLGGIWSQHYAQANIANQYTNIDSYNINNATYDKVWLPFYAGALPDLYLARDKAEKSGELGYWAIAEIMIAFDYHILVDFYGTVPFRQAINIDTYPAPEYDDGKIVNAGIIDILDKVIAKEADIKKATLTGNFDFVFNGNTDNWIRFAKTLKLKILLRDFDTNKAEIQALLADDDFLVADACMNGFQNVVSNSNPLYESDRRKLNTPLNLRASATMVTFLNSNNDPRVANYYNLSDTVKVVVKIDGKEVMKELVDANGYPVYPIAYRGMPQGAYSLTQSQLPGASISLAQLAATDPVYFTSVAESHFLQAEAYARLGDKTKAETLYKKGVRDAFERWKHGNVVDEFLSGVYKFDDTSLESMIKSIAIQKWIASVRCQAWDTFFDINRTGYPELGDQFTILESDWRSTNPKYVVGMLTPSLNSVLGAGKYPKRLLIPKISSDNNFKAPALIPITQKMWWQK